LKISNELTYEGELIDGKRDGYGILFENGEIIYQGFFKNDLK
jgi:hypothetical protein